MLTRMVDDLTLIKISDEELRAQVQSMLLMKSQEKRAEATELMKNVFMARETIYSVRDDEHRELWLYRDGIYIQNGQSYILEYCQKILREGYTTHLANQIIDKIRAQTFIDAHDFFKYDKYKNLIAVENGLFNLETGELEDFDPKKIFFAKFPIHFDTSANCPKIQQFVRSIIGNQQDFPVIQELFGWLFYKSYKFEKLVMFLGNGRNGKSKLCELMKRFVGVKNTVNLSPQVLEDTTSFQISRLFGKLVNISPDIDNTGLRRISNLKTLSGNDEITADRKFKTSIEFTNIAKMIFGANTLPIIYDIKAAIWERWLLVEFPYKFVSQNRIDDESDEDVKRYLKERDDEIIEKIATDTEMSGLFNWAYEGYLRLEKNKKFSYRHSPEQVRSIWIRRSDSFAAFMGDCLDFEINKKITKKELRRAYSQYCQDNALRGVGDKLISRHLSDMGVVNDREMLNENFTHIWDGVKFKEGVGIIAPYGLDKVEYSEYKPPSMKEKILLYIKNNAGENYAAVVSEFGEHNVKKVLREGLVMESRPNHLEVND
jgi:P4 family phage/plasmid primase-like protien